MIGLLMGTHAEVREFLLEYLERELPLLKRIRFGLHRLTCQRCLDYLRRYRESAALAQACLDEPPPEALVQLTLRFLDEHQFIRAGRPAARGPLSSSRLALFQYLMGEGQ